MHKIQIKYLYNIYVFVLSFIYSFSSSAAKASAVSSGYLTHNQCSHTGSILRNSLACGTKKKSITIQKNKKSISLPVNTKPSLIDRDGENQ